MTIDDAGRLGESTYAGERLAQLCRRLAQESGPLSAPGPMHDLANWIATEIRTGRDPGELDDAFDQLEDLLLRAGYAAGLSPSRSPYARLSGIGDGHPVLEVLACPAGQCARVEPPDRGGGEEPVCHVLQQPLRWVRLQP